MVLGGPKPWRGTQGTTQEYKTNLFSIERKSKKSEVHYWVVTSSDDRDAEGLRSLVGRNREALKEKFGDFVVTGGNLMTPKKPSANSVTVHDERDNVDVIVTYKNVQTATLHTYLENGIKRAQGEFRLARIGRKVYNINQPLQHDKFKFFRGYETGIQKIGDRLFLRADVSFRLLQPQTAWERIQELQQRSPRDFQSIIQNEFKGRTTVTKYLIGTAPPEKRVYKIDHVDFEKTPSTHKFEATVNKVTKEYTVAEYFQARYGIKVVPNAPLLVHVDIRRLKKAQQEQVDADVKLFEVFIPADQVELTGLNDEIRSDFRRNQQISNVTRMPPEKRAREISDVITTIHRQPILEKLDITLSPTPLMVKGRQIAQARADNGVIRVETCSDKNRKDKNAMPVFPPNANTWNWFANSVYTIPATFRGWIFVNLGDDKHTMDELVSSFRQCASTFRFPDGQPKILTADTRDRDWVSKLDAQGAQQGIDWNTQIPICLLPDRGGDRQYVALKSYWGDKGYAGSQCVKTVTVRKDPGKWKSIASKVLIQANCKFGGLAHYVSTPNLMNPPVLVVGLEIHKGPKCTTILVGDAKPQHTASRYYIRRSDGSPCVKLLMIEYLKAFGALGEARKIGALIVLRTGLNPSQKKDALEDTQEILEAMSCEEVTKVEPRWKTTPLAVLMVNKSSGLRLLHKDTKMNPLPLTVFDEGIADGGVDDTGKVENSFVIAHQSVTKTACLNPTKYDLVYPEDPFSLPISCDEIQKLMAVLSLSYQNWLGPVRVPRQLKEAETIFNKLSMLKGKWTEFSFSTKPWFL